MRGLGLLAADGLVGCHVWQGSKAKCGVKMQVREGTLTSKINVCK